MHIVVNFARNSSVLKDNEKINFLEAVRLQLCSFIKNEKNAKRPNMSRTSSKKVLLCSMKSPVQFTLNSARLHLLLNRQWKQLDISFDAC